MEDFFFHDIFASKNIDYLLALLSLCVLVPFWRALSGKARTETASSRSTAQARKHR